MADMQMSNAGGITYGATVDAQTLSKSFGKLQAVRAVNLNVNAGELTGLVGPDGAGKSTIVKMLAGISQPTSGDILVEGQPISQEKLKIGLVPQTLALYDELTVDDNMSFCARIRDIDMRQFKVHREQLLRSMGLIEARDRFAGRLSGGMKEKLALCCAMISQPKVLLLDEPTTGVDVLSRREMWRLLMSIASSGTAVLVALPNPEEAEYCHHIYFLDRGEIIRHASPAELREQLNLRRIELIPDRSADIAEIYDNIKSTVSGIDDSLLLDIHELGDRIAVIVKDEQAALRLLQETAPHVPMNVREISLEDAYVEILREHEGSGGPRLPEVPWRSHSKAVEAGEPPALPGLPTPASRQSPPALPGLPTPASRQSRSALPGLPTPASRQSGSAMRGSYHAEDEQEDQDALAVSGLRKRFGNFTAVDNIDFHVARGEIFGLLGANGAGKTTTIQMICGLVPNDEGSIEVLGQAESLRDVALRRRVGYMSQKFILYEELTVDETLKFYASCYGVSGAQLKEKVDWAVNAIGLQEVRQRKVQDFPRGWKQKIAFACSIMHEPELLFLDEPTAGVDPLDRRLMWSIIRQLADAGTAILVTTHLIDEAEYCNRLALMVDGRVVADGTPEQLKKTSDSSVYEISTKDPLKTFEALQESFDSTFMGLRPGKIRLLIVDRESGPSLDEIFSEAGLHPDQITETNISLQEAFIALLYKA